VLAAAVGISSAPPNVKAFAGKIAIQVAFGALGGQHR
jgi:hypothetical protein